MATRLTQSLAPYDVATYSIDQKLELGTEGVTPDGRRFRYVQCNASNALVPGKLYQSRAEDTTNWENLSIAAATAGTNTVTTTTTITAVKDLFAGGYLVVTQTPGLGYCYKIASNTAASTAVCTIILEDPIVVSLTTSSKIDIVPNPYKYIELWDASNHDGMAVGVAVAPITASYYGWIQTGGCCAVLGDNSSFTVGETLVGSDETDGAVGLFETDAASPIVGTAVTGIASADYGLANLNLN